MTKGEAIKIWGKRYEGFADGIFQDEAAKRDIDAMIDLGILKVEEPRTATERALNALNALFYDRFSEVESEDLCKALDEVGVRIVDK